MQASAVPYIVDTNYPPMISTENVASNEAPMSSGFQYTGSVCNERKPFAGNTSASQVSKESVVHINSSAFTVTTPTGSSNTSNDNISLTPIEVVSDILDANQHEEDINLIDDATKYLPSNEKLDSNQAKVSTPFPSDCNQSREVLALSSETDCSQLANSSHLNAHLPISSNTGLSSNDTLDMQNMDFT